MRISLIIFLSFYFFLAHAQQLTNSTVIQITKTWSQQPSGWTYPIYIHVPQGTAPQDGYPVCIGLHGNGGSGTASLNQFTNMLDCHIIVAPSGYQGSWNICRENSDAPDVEMLSELIAILQTYSNVNPNKIRLAGSSNGSALVHRAFIEIDNAGVDMYVGIVSQLNEPQFHMGDFYGPKGITDTSFAFCGYDSVHTTPNAVKFLTVCNVNDPIIPFNGGSSNVGVSFLPAPVSTHIIAESQGYTGVIIGGPGTQLGSSNVYEYSYLNDQVVLLRGDAFHGMDSTQRNYVTDFMEDCSVNTSTGKVFDKKNEYEMYPNPFQDQIHINCLNFRNQIPYTIYNSMGQEILSGQLQSENNLIRIPEMATGLLFIKLPGKVMPLIRMK